MRQVVQDFRTGEVRLLDVDPPALRSAFVRVKTAASVVSPGTERAILALARKSLLGKAKARPDLVARVLKKLKRDGLVAAFRTVKDRLDAPLPLGYAAAGTVLEAAPGAIGFVRGDRVACAGAGYANHAEEIVVPRNLAAHVPEGVPLEDAAFSTLGAIAMNAFRAADLRLGDRIGVLGVGLLGALAVRIAKAAGVRVLAVDLDPAKLLRATADGAEVVASPDDAAAAAKAWTNRVGVDAVVIAAASDDDGPISLAADLLRRAGTVVALGDVPLKLPRRLYYAKEAVLKIATSYGPGRYDRAYEEGGRDYPLPYVRWTAGRNLEAFLALLSSGAVKVADLGERIRFADSLAAYERLAAGSAAKAFVFTYPDAPTSRAMPTASRAAPAKGLRTALAGAGAFGRSVLWPALSAAGLVPSIVSTASGPTAAEAAKRLSFPRSTTDALAAVNDAESDVVVIATPHDLHAELATAALAAGKQVLVEKPLAIDEKGLARVEKELAGAGGILMVGFNRRFAAASRAAKAFLDKVPGPSVVTYRVNAGEIPDTSWIADAAVSGGRLVGEACHMVDLAAFLCGEKPVRVAAARAGRGEDLAIVIAFSGGSVATITYHAMGDPSIGKERIEIARGDRVATISDFREATFSKDGESEKKKFPADKGHAEEARAFVAAVKAGGPPPIPYEDLFAVTRATFAAVRAIASGRFEDV